MRCHDADPIDPFAEALVARKNQTVRNAADNGALGFFQIVHLFKKGFRVLTLQGGEAKANGPVKYRDLLFAVSMLDLDRAPPIAIAFSRICNNMVILRFHYANGFGAKQRCPTAPSGRGSDSRPRAS